MGKEVYKTASDVIKQETDLFQASIDGAKGLLPGVEASVESFTRLIVAIETDAYGYIESANNLVDDIIGFYNSRITTSNELTVYNNSIVGVLNTTTDSTYNPNTSVYARNYLSSINEAAWVSNTILDFNENGTTRTQDFDSDGIFDPIDEINKIYYYRVDVPCDIELNEEDHWEGDFTTRIAVDYIYNTVETDEEGNPITENVPVLVCPINNREEAGGVIAINKYKVTIFGYNYEGENPIEQIQTVTLNNETAGIGTFSKFENVKNTYDVGINTDNSISFTYDGVSYSGDVTEGSSNYETFVKPKLDEIESLRARAVTMINDVNALKTARMRSELYKWSLEYSIEENEEKIDTNERYDPIISKYSNEIDRQDGFTGGGGVNIPEELPRVPPFEDLTVTQKEDLSEIYGLGYPKETTIIEGDNPVVISDEGYNRNYNDAKLKKFLTDNPSLPLVGDYVLTQPGSIIVYDSTGAGVTYTGLTTQINQIKSGTMSTDNVVGIQTFEAIEYNPGAGNTSYVFLPPVPNGAFQTFYGSIGTVQQQWQDVYSRFFYGELVGSASSVATNAVLTGVGDSIDYPLLFVGGANTQGRSPSKPLISGGLTYNPVTGSLSVGIISATTIVNEEVGTANSVEVYNGEDFPASQTGYILIAPGRGEPGVASTELVYGDDSFTFNPDTGQLIATSFVGSSGSFSEGVFTTGIVTANEIDANIFTGVTTVSFDNSMSIETNNNGIDIVYNNDNRVTITTDGLIGIGSTQPIATLDIDGGINVIDLNVTGITTVGEIDVGSLNISGVSTINTFFSVSIGTTDINVTGVGTFNEIESTSIESTDINVTGFLTSTSIESTNINNSGVITSTGADFTSVNVTGVATFVDLNASTTNVTTLGFGSAIGDQLVLTGVITAKSGIFTDGYFENLLVDEYYFESDGNTDVNDANDTIVIGSDNLSEIERELSTGDIVRYTPGNPTIGGLSSATDYYVEVVSTNTISLYSDAARVNKIDITSSGSDGVHTFTKYNIGIGTFHEINSDHVLTENIDVTGIATIGFSTITNGYVGYNTVGGLTIQGTSNYTSYSISNVEYTNTSGITTITVGSDIGFDGGDVIRLKNIVFNDGTFPTPPDKFEYYVDYVIDDRNFVLNIGTAVAARTYLSGGEVQTGNYNEYIFPIQDGNSGQVLVTDGGGNLTFASADTFGGTRVHVSSVFGDDTNDGVDLPVKTIKRAAQIACALSFEDQVMIMVASGDYSEDNPIILSDNISIVGNDLRSVLVRPKNRDKDMFRVRNGCYLTGFTLRDAVTYPVGEGVRNDILAQARDYAQILVNGDTASATEYRTDITPITTPAIAGVSTQAINDRIESLVSLATTSFINESTSKPSASIGNVDQEFIDAADLIISNIGDQSTAKDRYIPGNAVGWATDSGGGNYTLDHAGVSTFQSEVQTIFAGISSDLRYGGEYGNEYTMLALRKLIVGTPSFTFDYGVSFDDPNDDTTDRSGYVGLSSDKPRITRSPYIQNISIISFLGANGANVDGSKIIQDNIPRTPEEAENPAIGDVPDQGKSMVANAFTMVSFGGIGWKVSNSGYAQIVSCFQIFCEVGSYAQTGGYLSITNSATNFGLYALRSTGFRSLPFDTDKGTIFTDGTNNGSQTLKVGGLGRDDQDQYVLRFINILNGDDETASFKQAGVTTSTDETGINTTTNQVDFGNNYTSFSEGDDVFYVAPNDQSQIGGLTNGTSYFVGFSSEQASFFFDAGLTKPVDLTSAPVGIHTFSKVAERFFVSEVIETHSRYQNLTLSDAIGSGVTFTPGNTISQSRSDGTVAVGFAQTWTDTVLTVSLENSTNTSGSIERLSFQSSPSGGSISDSNNTTTTVTNVDNRSDIFTIEFKVGSTIIGSDINNISTLPGSYFCHFHRPSIVNSSAHTWEYAGSGTDYNALPENGGIADEAFEQTSENGGRVYTSGTNELGDFKVGDAITAFNRTGNIIFNNQVSIGSLDVLELSLSEGVSITEISTSSELGTDELNGPQNSRLTTQKAIYDHIQTHLGPFFDATKSTQAIPAAVPQLNSQGLLDSSMIPPNIRFNNVFEVNVSGGRTDLCNDIPAIEVLKSDIVTEEYGNPVVTNNYSLVFENESQFLVLSSETNDYSFSNGDDLIASQNGATGIVTIPTHPSYGTTGLVKGVMQAITIGVAGTGYNTAGIYSGVQVLAETGIGTGAEADVTVSGTGTIEAVNIRRGGRYYAQNDTFTFNSSDLGGVDVGFTTVSCTVTDVDTRLYVLLNGDRLQFNASTGVPDFISDGTAGSASTSISTIYTETFLPTSKGTGGDIYFSDNSIELPTDHEFKDGDPVLYRVTGGIAVDNLQAERSYFIKTIGISSIQLADDYAGNTIITLDSSGTGTHQLRRTGVSTDKNAIVFVDHGFTTGNSVRFISSDSPSGLVNNDYYFVGSATTNSFTLHDVRQDALSSVNGVTINAKDITTNGVGIVTFQEQNVTFTSTVNTSSNNENNFSILVSSADIDASNIISGVIDQDRLASVGTPNDTTFLRGDQSWSRATQQISVASTDTEALTVTAGTPGGVESGVGVNTYFGNITMAVAGVSTNGVGSQEYSTTGTVKLRYKQDSVNLGPFNVRDDNSFLVDLQTTFGDTNNNGIDAKQFGGQTLAQVVNLTTTTVNGNSRGVLKSTNGGTGSNNSSGSSGSILVGDGSNPTIYTATVDPQISGSLGVGFNGGTIKGTIDVDQVGSIDTFTLLNHASTDVVSVFEFDKTDFRSVKLVIQCTNNTDDQYHSTEMLVIHDDTTAYNNEYASIFTEQQCTYSVDVSGNNVRVRATPNDTDDRSWKVMALGMIRV